MSEFIQILFGVGEGGGGLVSLDLSVGSGTCSLVGLVMTELMSHVEAVWLACCPRSSEGYDYEGLQVVREQDVGCKGQGNWWQLSPRLGYKVKPNCTGAWGNKVNSKCHTTPHNLLLRESKHSVRRWQNVISRVYSSLVFTPGIICIPWRERDWTHEKYFPPFPTRIGSFRIFPAVYIYSL